MSQNPNKDNSKGEFETFRSAWLLQVAADRVAKAATPVAIVLAVAHLNRKSGNAWPGISRLAAATGAASTNTVRSALKVLEERGHAFIKWSDGGKNKTHIITPLVNGKPFRQLKDIATDQPFKELNRLDEPNPSSSGPETLQVSEHKPFKDLNPNQLNNPFEDEGAAQAAPSNTETALNIDSGTGLANAARTASSGKQHPSAGEIHRDVAAASETLCEYRDDVEPAAGKGNASFEDKNDGLRPIEDGTYLQLVKRCEKHAFDLSPLDAALLKKMRAALNNRGALTSIQKRVLEEEILPEVRRLQNQPAGTEFDFNENEPDDSSYEAPF